MRTVDRQRVRAPAARMFDLAADVAQWPARLAHYRWVRFHEQRADGGVVEMAAVRPFGPLRWPVWWESEMWVNRGRLEVHYRHLRGVTRGMEVRWVVQPAGEECEVTIVHEWGGPGWPLIGRAAAGWVIGPVFVHGIASRTLAGLARVAEASSG